jgi:hypothetical protein
MLRSGDASLPGPNLTAGLAQDPTVDLDHVPRHFRLPQELGRRKEAPFGMVPPHQRLDAGDEPAREVHHGLVVDDELLGLESLLELRPERSRGELTRPQVGAEDAPPALPARLRRVHRRVRLAEQLVEPFVVGARGDADADTDGHVAR